MNRRSFIGGILAAIGAEFVPRAKSEPVPSKSRLVVLTYRIEFPPIKREELTRLVLEWNKRNVFAIPAGCRIESVSLDRGS